MDTTMIDTLTMNGQTITLDYDPVDKPAHYNLNGGIECIDYIKEVVAMYTDTRQHHCEEAQCILAMNMIHMVLKDIEYVIKKRPAQEKRLLAAIKIAANLRNQMLDIFGYNPTKTDTNFS